MKKWGWMLLLPALAGAASLPYAKRWPLVLAASDEGAYRVALSPQVYATAVWPDLRDIDVVDAHGKPVAAALFGPEQPLARPAAQVAVPWFPLPAPGAGDATGVRLSAQFDANGRILHLDAQSSPSSSSPANADGGSGFLVDLSSIREPVAALAVEWTPGVAREAAYRVDASDDLQAWQLLHARAALVELQHDGRQLLRNEVPLAGSWRYLRFIPVAGTPALPVHGVRVRLASTVAQPPRAWVMLAGTQGRAQGKDVIEFRNTGRYPVTVADLAGGDNAVGEWTLESRDQPDAPWQYRAGPWVAWRVGGQHPGASLEQPLAGAPVRDHYWRLRSAGALPAQLPQLRLGYRPEVLVFLAQGTPPYAVVAGSGAARRTPVPLPALVDALRAQRGQDWQPAPAYLGAPATLAGEAALTPPPPPRDWKTWLLWALLGAGALLVAGFAASLLRQPQAPD